MGVGTKEFSWNPMIGETKDVNKCRQE